MSDRSELLAAMYAADDSEQKKPNIDGLMNIQPGGRSTRVEIDGQSFELPNMAYIMVLERTIRQQAKDLKNLATMLNNTRNFIRQQTMQIRSANQHVQEQLDTKITGHDML